MNTAIATKPKKLLPIKIIKISNLLKSTQNIINSVENLSVKTSIY